MQEQDSDIRPERTALHGEKESARPPVIEQKGIVDKDRVREFEQKKQTKTVSRFVNCR